MVILEVLKAIIDNFGSAIIVPVIITVIALIFKVKPEKQFFQDFMQVFLCRAFPC